MTSRERVVLALLIESPLLRWNAGGITDAGEAFPLLQSEANNLNQYHELNFEDQVSFLRHRLAGALQRGCDRLFSREMKVKHFVIVADGLYPNSADDLTQRVADHFVAWMMNPPVTYLVTPKGFKQLPASKVVAGEFPEEIAKAIYVGLPKLVERLELPNQWELVTRPPRTETSK